VTSVILSLSKDQGRRAQAWAELILRQAQDDKFRKLKSNVGKQTMRENKKGAGAVVAADCARESKLFFLGGSRR
jgi:hypothetical protein